jgi:transcription elongation factor Elf1
MPTASGFPCPKCTSPVLADITSKDLVHILELKCRKCGAQWAVESSHPNRRFRAQDGKVWP